MKKLAEKFTKDFDLPGNRNQDPQFIADLQEAARRGFVAGYREGQLVGGLVGQILVCVVMLLAQQIGARAVRV